MAGADSGKVVIWNMAPVVSRKAEADENIPKMLCQMDNHEGSVARSNQCSKQSSSLFIILSLISYFCLQLV